METPIVILDTSQVAQARRQAQALAVECGLSEVMVGRVALVVTEMGTNILKYGGGGEIVLRACRGPADEGVEIIALDRGPGMRDVRASAADGFSTGSTLGLGLGSISRLSDASDIYTSEGGGTAWFARVTRPRDTPEPSSPVRNLLASGMSVAKPGQQACGDMWSEKRLGGARWIIITDGLGHGPQAALASAAALRTFHAAAEHASPVDVIRAAHIDLKYTRGAVVAVAVIRPALGFMEFAGVGNIAAALYRGGETKRIGSSDGTVGYSLRTVRDQSFTWHPDSTLVMATDGLSTRWNLASHPGLLTRHPSLISAVLYRDYSRHNDDATVVVAKDY